MLVTESFRNLPNKANKARSLHTRKLVTENVTLVTKSISFSFFLGGGMERGY